MSRAGRALGLAAAALLAAAAGGAQKVATGDLAALRAEALALVNDARADAGLEALAPAAPLEEAAQGHARDMLLRGYYAHASPEGETVADRFVAAGGDRWKLTAENIAECLGCSGAPALADVRDFQRGWMESPEHRDNILAEGLESFGFGIAGGGERLYAVQTFAGPGVSPEAEPGAARAPLAPEAGGRLALEEVNAARARGGLGPLEPSPPLDAAAKAALRRAGSSAEPLEPPEDLFALLPEGEAEDWTALWVVTAECGGCGTEAIAADLRHFTGQWLDGGGGALLAPEAEGFGFAMRAWGEGRKSAVAVAGRRR